MHDLCVATLLIFYWLTAYSRGFFTFTHQIKHPKTSWEFGPSGLKNYLANSKRVSTTLFKHYPEDLNPNPNG
jgi:hypothetical protein